MKGTKRLHRWAGALIILIFIISGCSSGQGISLVATKTEQTLFVSTVTATRRPSHTPTEKLLETATPTLTQTPPPPTPSPSPTPITIYNDPGFIEAPILLYHHVKGNTYENRYQVSIPDFKAQMNALYEMGYHTIPMSMFIEALLSGADLPEKPVVITFDDGHESVYQNAFPIMQSYGFTGVFYIVANRIRDVNEFVNVEEIKTMVDAGWEIGSHGFSHADLTLDHNIASKEIGQSRTALQEALSVEIQTFAYPFGKIDSVVAGKVIEYGYAAGMGLGIHTTHTPGSLYYLERREVYGEYSLEQFIGLLTEE